MFDEKFPHSTNKTAIVISFECRNSRNSNLIEIRADEGPFGD